MGSLVHISSTNSSAVAKAASAVAGLSVTDESNQKLIVDNKRTLQVTNTDEYSMVQVGRLLYRETNQDPLKWASIPGGSGSGVIYDASSALYGERSMRMTTPAASGGEVLCQKVFQLASDQSESAYPLVIAEWWFGLNDANMRSITCNISLDDGNVAWLAGMQFIVQVTGSPSGAVEYNNSSNAYSSVGTYRVTTRGGISQPWHHCILALNYLQGVGGYCTYAAMVVDDYLYAGNAAGSPKTAPSAFSTATAGYSQSSLLFTVTSDNRNGTSVNLDEILFCDMSNLMQLGV